MDTMTRELKGYSSKMYRQDSMWFFLLVIIKCDGIDVNEDREREM